MMGDTTGNLRAFVAVELDSSLRQELSVLQARLRQAPPARLGRWVDVAGIHLTLKFLGDVSPHLLPELQRAMERACDGIAPLEMTVEGLGCFPNKTRPRVLWVGIREASGGLARLQEALERELRRLGFKADERSFSPHLTLARLRDSAHNRERAEFGAWVCQQDIGHLGLLRVHEIALMQSILRPEGTLYKRLGTAPLRPWPR